MVARGRRSSDGFAAASAALRARIQAARWAARPASERLRPPLAAAIPFGPNAIRTWQDVADIRTVLHEDFSTATQVFEVAAAAGACVGAAALRHRLPLPVVHLIYAFARDDEVLFDDDAKLMRGDLFTYEGLPLGEAATLRRLRVERESELRGLAVLHGAAEDLRRLMN
eukprot:6095958-Alexandrium_andersonii.AAC.1